MEWGVPQGSVVGPELFVAYSSPIEDIIKRHGLSSMFYADDSQLYVIIKPDERPEILTRLEACIREIRLWLSENMLMLNDGKTELLHVRSRYANNVPDVTIKIGDTEISSSAEVRNLGVLFDDRLTMTSQVNSICRRASFGIHKIGKLRRYLDPANTKKLVHAFVSSRLDNCNSLLAGLPDKELDKLQRVQNAAARVITLTRKYAHITPVLYNLHWLPIKQRIAYKILLLTFKIIHGQAPSYLSELIAAYNPPRSLRSESQKLLCEQPGRTATYGRYFAAVAPKLWNSLPYSIKDSGTIDQFKTHIKTHLFKQAYN